MPAAGENMRNVAAPRQTGSPAKNPDEEVTEGQPDVDTSPGFDLSGLWVLGAMCIRSLLPPLRHQQFSIYLQFGTSWLQCDKSALREADGTQTYKYLFSYLGQEKTENIPIWNVLEQATENYWLKIFVLWQPLAIS